MALADPGRLIALIVIAGSGAVVGACSAIDLTGSSTCAGVGYYALDVAVRDQFGQSQALGATVTITDGSFTEADTSLDSLHVYAASERGGRTYDIRVSKPYHTDAVVRGVKTRGGGCVTGHENPPVMITVPVTLTTAPGAPAMRAIRFVPAYSVLLDRPPHQSAVRPLPVFDADPGVSRAVTWSISGFTTPVSFDSATGTVTYLCGPKSDSVMVTARSVVNPAVSFTQSVRFQGHPANSTDPPC